MKKDNTSKYLLLSSVFLFLLPFLFVYWLGTRDNYGLGVNTYGIFLIIFIIIFLGICWLFAFTIFIARVVSFFRVRKFEK